MKNRIPGTHRSKEKSVMNDNTSSFYEWQGFMEGAAVSGITTANQILKDFKVKTKTR